MVMARFEYPNNGSKYDTENVKKQGLVVGNEYPVANIFMGQSRTSIYLDGFNVSFNSVRFEFFEDGTPLNIFRDSRFNPYILGGHSGQQ